MKAFAQLITVLGTSTKTNDKLDTLVHYFATALDRDKVWVIALFSGRRPKRLVNAALLKKWCMEETELPEWLFEEAYHTAGDLAETIALLLPPPVVALEEMRTLASLMDEIIAQDQQPEENKRAFVTKHWKEMTQGERFVFNKLLTGNFRIGVSQKTIVNALAKATGVTANLIAHRITGNWDPVTIPFEELMSETATAADNSKPYPFCLSYAVDDVHALGNANDWQAEWKWDGIRGQVIRREGELFVWSRGEELVTEKFPEYTNLLQALPDGIVLDGEIIPSVEGKPLPFALLQTRIGRKNVTKKHLQEVPVTFFAYDILEYEGKDIRDWPLLQRRELLESITQQANHPLLLLSPVVGFSSWDELTTLRESSRDNGAEGLMLKNKNSIYHAGRKTGDWWKWKVDPLTIDGVLIYAQKGHGRRSNLYTDYTFAVRDGDQLVSFAKAYSGLTDKEFAQVDAFIKRNSIEKFGPVRTVKPELVFEIAFEGIAASNRHKSGVALRFPRMHRWRTDKKPEEINTLDDLKKMLEAYGK